MSGPAHTPHGSSRDSPELREADARLRVVLRAGGLAIWEANVTRRTLRWSPEMFALHGLASGQPPPPHYWPLVHPEDRERVRLAVEEARAEHRDHSVQYRVCWRDGSVHWLEGTGTTLITAGGETLMMGVCKDIDARKRDESDLRFIARASAELAAVTDYRETLTRVARLAVPHFADWVAVDMLAGGDKLDRLAVAHVEPAKVELADQLYQRFQHNPDTQTGAWRAIRTRQPLFIPEISPAMLEVMVPNAEYRAAIESLGLHSYMCVPILSRTRVLGAISFVTSESRRLYTPRDLANATDLAARAAIAVENAELVQALRESDAAKDVFLATLAHELRNPLAPIMNAVAILRLPYATQDARSRMLDLTERQVRHLVRLVDDLLEVSRITRGKIDLRCEQLDLRDIVRASVEACGGEAQEPRHRIETQLLAEPLLIHADLARIKQVIDNLLGNAIKYTPDGGRITVSAQAVDNSAVLRVQDDGGGIPPAMLGKVFDMFTQADRNKGGLGIGLALVKQLVQLHGGSVQAHSQGPGTGATFTVRLPLARSSAPGLAAHSAPLTATMSPRRVLVIDDNVDAADTLAMLVSACGHQVETAYDGPSGLAAAARMQPDCVFLDIGMPGMSGHEVARALRASDAGARARIVAVTGWGLQQDRDRTRESGFDGHLVKPVEVAAVMQLLDSLNPPASPM